MNDRALAAFRSAFPVVKKYVYLDHAGVSPMPLPVRQAIGQFLAEASEGGAFFYPQWAGRIAKTREAAAVLVNAGPEELAFVKSTSHGLSLVAQGLDWNPGDNVIVCEKEFPSNLYPWLMLREKGVEVRMVRFRGGGISPDDIGQLMDSRTRLLSLSSVQFSNGFRLDLRSTGRLCRSRKVLFCVDAIQSLGALPMDVQDCCIDFLSADAHKWLLGPEGIGIFYCRRDLVERLRPALVGWRSVRNEFDFDHPRLALKTDAGRFEEGSLNVPGVVGLGAALALLQEAGIQNIEQQVQGLGDHIIAGLEQRGCRLLTPKERTSRGGIVTFAGAFDPAAVRDRLQSEGIMVNVRGGGLRVSPHFYNNEEDLTRFFTAFDRACTRAD